MKSAIKTVCKQLFVKFAGGTLLTDEDITTIDISNISNVKVNSVRFRSKTHSWKQYELEIMLQLSGEKKSGSLKKNR